MWCSPKLSQTLLVLAINFLYLYGLNTEQMIESRFKELLNHSVSLLQRRWMFGILDDFITKQLPHNVTWGLSLLYAVEHKGDRALVSTQGLNSLITIFQQC